MTRLPTLCDLTENSSKLNWVGIAGLQISDTRPIVERGMVDTPAETECAFPISNGCLCVVEEITQRDALIPFSFRCRHVFATQDIGSLSTRTHTSRAP